MQFVNKVEVGVFPIKFYDLLKGVVSLVTFSLIFFLLLHVSLLRHLPSKRKSINELYHLNNESSLCRLIRRKVLNFTSG